MACRAVNAAPDESHYKEYRMSLHSNNPAMFDGRAIYLRSAASIMRGDQDILYGMSISKEDAPFVAVLYGEDLGHSVSVAVDLRTDEVVYRAEGMSDTLIEMWVSAVKLLADAEVIFDAEMTVTD
jgi:hypothetical protein